MNELKAMATKAKSRLLNKGLREIYCNINKPQITQTKIEDFNKPSLDIMDENLRKKYLLNMIKNRVNN